MKFVYQACGCQCVWVWVSYEHGGLEAVLSFDHVGSGDQIQVIRLGCECLYLPSTCTWSHLTGPASYL